jgi:hypothetical protein
MAAAAKARLPPHQPTPVPLLCIRDANILELIYIVHERRQKRCAQLGLGALSLQGAMCLYLATRDDLTSDQKIELEDAARFEDDRNPRFPETQIQTQGSQDKNTTPRFPEIQIKTQYYQIYKYNPKVSRDRGQAPPTFL